MHCVKIHRIWSYSLHFPTFALNAEKYGASLCIQSESGKIRSRFTPNTDIFDAVKSWQNQTSINNNEEYAL